MRPYGEVYALRRLNVAADKIQRVAVCSGSLRPTGETMLCQRVHGRGPNSVMMVGVIAGRWYALLVAIDSDLKPIEGSVPKIRPRPL